MFKFYRQYTEKWWLPLIVSFAIFFYTRNIMPHFFVFIKNFWLLRIFFASSFLISVYLIAGIVVTFIRNFKKKEFMKGIFNVILFLFPLIIIVVLYIFYPLLMLSL